MRRQPQDCRELNQKLEHASSHESPGRISGKARHVQPSPEGHDGGNQRQIQHHAGDIGQEKLAVTVQDPEAPCSPDQHSNGRKEDSNQQNGQSPALPLKSGRDGINQIWAGHNAHQNKNRGDQQQQREDSAGHPAGLLASALCKQAGVNGDERRREHPFAEQVLQHVGNPLCGTERVCRVGQTQVMPENIGADESREAAQQDSESHPERRTPDTGMGWFSLWSGVAHRCASVAYPRPPRKPGTDVSITSCPSPRRHRSPAPLRLHQWRPAPARPESRHGCCRRWKRQTCGPCASGHIPRAHSRG